MLDQRRRRGASWHAVQVRQERDALRISFPPQLFRDTDAHLRLGVPAGLEYVIKAGSADVSVERRHRPVQDQQRLGRHQRRPGRRPGLLHRLGRHLGRPVAGSGGRGWRPDPATSASARSAARSPPSPGPATSPSSRCRQPRCRPAPASGDIAVTSTSGSVDLRTASGSLTIGVADQLPAWLDLRLGLRASPDRPGVDRPAGAGRGVRVGPGAHGLRRHRGLPRLSRAWLPTVRSRCGGS